MGVRSPRVGASSVDQPSRRPWGPLFSRVPGSPHCYPRILGRAVGSSRTDLLFLLLALLALGLFGWACVEIWRYPYDGGFWTDRESVVIDVVPGEAADAADIQVGDRLLAVDGVPLDRLEGLYRGKVPGDVVTYVLERGGDRVDASVVLAEQPLSMLLHQAIQLSVGLAFCLIGIVAWRLRRSDRVVRLAFLFSQFGAISLSTQFLSSLRWPGLLLAAEGSLALVVPLAVHLYSIFPEEIRGRGARILIGSAYAAGGLLLAWTVVEHTTKGSLHISGLLVASRRAYGGIALVGALGLLIYPPTASYVRSRLFRKVRADQGSG